MKNRILKYYGKTLDLVGMSPTVDEKSLQLLQQYEKQYQIRFPEAVKAWYGLANRHDILSYYSTFDDYENLETLLSYEIWDDITAEEVCNAEFQRISEYNRLTKARRLIGALSEQDGMIQWFFLAEKRDDAKVWAYFELTYPDQLLTNYPNTFSELIYTNVWDTKLRGLGVNESPFGQTKGFRADFMLHGEPTQYLPCLLEHFQPCPTTDLTIYSKIDRQIFRFEEEDVMVGYWQQQPLSQLFLYAATPNAYQNLLTFFTEVEG